MKSVRGEFDYGAEKIRYEVRFLETRRTLGIEVHPDLSVIVRAPVDCDLGTIESRLRKRASWISKQLAQFRRYSPRTPCRQYVSGETHLYLGRQYRLKVVEGETSLVRLNRGLLAITLPGKPEPEQVKGLLHRWYLDHARAVFGEILDDCLCRFKVQDRPRLIIRTMQSRWGSLSPAGSVTLNANLIRAPRVCIEYVATHELCHLTYRDHNAGFYRLLEKMMPDWEKRKQRLETALL